MKQTEYIDDLMINAFVDGQLDAGNCENVLAAMENDPQTRERVYLMRRAKDLMKVGFEHVESPLPAAPIGKKRRLFGRSAYGLAASLLVMSLGFGSGIFGYYFTKQLSGGTSVAAMSTTRDTYTDRVVLHLSESDPKQFSAALGYIEKFLHDNQAPGSQIEVIANSGGLDLMRSDKSPFKTQVVAMIRDHDNVHFIACANGIRNLRKQGDNPPIIRNIDTDKTAIDHIIGRLQAGWTYVKVDNIPEI
jgi:intracellular sulfur oxidation DsrE/DsrF family protein